MTHEKIYKRKDGSRVKISVWLYVHENKSNWGYLLFFQEKGSDRWLDPFTDREYLKRVVALKSNDGLRMDTFDSYVSKEEILKAKMELWEMIRPV
jgi:hypothetical protein